MSGVVIAQQVFPWVQFEQDGNATVLIIKEVAIVAQPDLVEIAVMRAQPRLACGPAHGFDGAVVFGVAGDCGKVQVASALEDFTEPGDQRLVQQFLDGGARFIAVGIDAFALTAVPLFILTGDVLVRTGLSRKFLDVAEALTQFAKGGFGSATVLVCGMFAAISGSDAAGAAAVGRMTIARLVESGYPRPYACALVAAGACTGILIPPSIAYIIIGLVLGISASTLFLAALIPGLAILISILVTNLVVHRIHGYEGGGDISMGEYFSRLAASLKSGWYAFIVPGIIFYGIFSGKAWHNKIRPEVLGFIGAAESQS